MAATFGSGSVKTTLASAGTQLIISAFSLSGSDRCMIVGCGARVSSDRTFTLTRSTDAFEELIHNFQDNGGATCLGALFGSTNEPTASSTALQVDISGAAVTHWGIGYVGAYAADQTTRTENEVLNTDHVGSAAAMSVTTSTDDLVVDFFVCRTSNNVISEDDFAPGGSQNFIDEEASETDGNDSYIGCSWLAGSGASVNMSWTASTHADSTNHMAVNIPALSSTPPTNTVPTSGTQIVKLNTATATSGTLSVASGSSQITSVRLQSSLAGAALTVTLSGSASISAGANGSTDLTIGASNDTDYNNTLATLSLTATGSGKTTITVTSSDGTLSDVDTWYILCGPTGITISSTTDNYTNLVDTVATITGTLNVGQTAESITLYAEDDTSPTPLNDTQVISFLVASGAQLASLTRRYQRGNYRPLRDAWRKWIRRRRERR